MLKGKAKKDYQAKYMKDKRSNKPSEMLDPDVRPTDVLPEDIPPIIRALADPTKYSRGQTKREKLERIYQSLENHNVAEHVWFGIGRGAVSFDVVGKLLDATK